MRVYVFRGIIFYKPKLWYWKEKLRYKFASFSAKVLAIEKILTDNWQMESKAQFIIDLARISY